MPIAGWACATSYAAASLAHRCICLYAGAVNLLSVQRQAQPPASSAEPPPQPILQDLESPNELQLASTSSFELPQGTVRRPERVRQGFQTYRAPPLLMQRPVAQVGEARTTLALEPAPHMDNSCLADDTCARCQWSALF